MNNNISSLNESPSEKEGKFHALDNRIIVRTASMKAPPKRKGNGRCSE